MKKLFICALAVGMFTACSQEETLSTQAPMQISFDGAFVNNATRAVDAKDPSTTTSLISTFDVWGYVEKSSGTVFNDVTVTKSGEAWTYSPLQYWLPGQTYRFFALTPDNAETVKKTLSTDPYNAGLGTIEFTNKEGTEDILYATAERTTAATITDEAKVKFAFDHLLSKVKFTFKNGFATGYSTIEVTNIKITNAPSKGTVTLGVTQPEAGGYVWTPGTEPVVLSFGHASGDKTVGEGDQQTTIGIAETTQFESDDERLTIPASADQKYTVTFTVKLYQDQALVLTDNKTVEITGCELKSGHAYNFITTIDPSNVGPTALDPIEFEAEVDEWVEPNEFEFSVPTNVATEAELVAAIKDGGDIKLTADITLTETLNVAANTTLNLNGKTLTNSTTEGYADVITVAEGAKLTIEGEGNVTAIDGNVNFAVIAQGEVIINGGTFKSGKDAKGDANACIYATGEGKVTINGGDFSSADGKFVLNLKDKSAASITVYGGTFHNFDPANNASENPAVNFVAEGYESVQTAENVWTVQAIAE